MARLLRTFVVFLGLGCSIAFCQGPATQSPACAVPTFGSISKQPNFFSDEQEEWLGDVIDQMFRKEFRVIEDPDGYLQKLGDRLVAQLPASKIHYRFFIVDAPQINSFGTAGGRIYIFRRMISFTQNEDELAALLGHEIGHIATHQAAIEVSEFMRQLDIAKVGDQRDITDKWHQVVDNAAKIKASGSEKREQEEQLIADRVGLYSMARAGYDPNRAIDFLDRLFQTKRKTGGFWSDFFGRTSSDAKRLREAMRNAALSRNCITPLPHDSAATFAGWQKAVIESKVAVRKEEVSGVLHKATLTPQLRGDLQGLHFSPDGEYLLAQDESSIFVLKREPLANLFRIDAAEAFPASFSPDSRSIVFYDKEYRVEKWDIGSEKRTSIHQITLPMRCLQTILSPTGEALACVTNEFELQIIDVEKSTVLFSRKKAYQPSEWEAYFLDILQSLGVPLSLFHMRFSPDGRYLLVGHEKGAIAYDFSSHQELKLPKSVKEIVSRVFTFLSANEVTGIQNGIVSRLRFPSGEPIEAFPFTLQFGDFVSATHGEYLLLLNSNAAVRVLDLKTKKPLFGYKSPGLDIYDQSFAGESTGGDVGIFTLSDQKASSMIHLPESPLGHPRAAAFSADGKWLAVSGPTRGAIWNVETGERMFHILGFEGAFFDSDRLVAKFPKHEGTPSRVFQFNPSDKTTKLLYSVSDEKPDTVANGVSSDEVTMQLGELLLAMVPDSKKPFVGRIPMGLPEPRRFTMRVYDVRTKNKLWERPLPKHRPDFFHSSAGKTLTMVVSDYDDIRVEAKADPTLNARLQTIGGKEGKKDSYVIRVFDSITGNDLGTVLIDTGNLSFRVQWANTIKDMVLVGDSENRTLVYSLKSGAQIGKVFGRPRAVSGDGARMLVEGNDGKAALYEIATLAQIGQFTFSSRIVEAQFTADGASLMVLTADQGVYHLQMGPAKEAVHPAEDIKPDTKAEK